MVTSHISPLLFSVLQSQGRRMSLPAMERSEVNQASSRRLSSAGVDTSSRRLSSAGSFSRQNVSMDQSSRRSSLADQSSRKLSSADSSSRRLSGVDQPDVKSRESRSERHKRVSTSYLLLCVSLSVMSQFLSSDSLCPPLKKEGHIALHMSVGRYVGIP